MIFYASPTATQLEQLYHVDLKTFEVCWDYEEWMQLQGREFVLAATAYNRAIGCLIGAKEKSSGDGRILKVFVDKKFRRDHVAAGLLSRFEHFCSREWDCRRINIILPEGFCQPKSDCLGFLQGSGMRATKVFRKLYSIMGRTEDGYQFDKEIT